MHSLRKYQTGFTLIEVIAVLIILGILAAVVISRGSDMDTSLYSETEVIKTHLRYAQTQAMNRTTTPASASPVLAWGLTCDGSSYWLFKGTTANVQPLPDNASDSNNKVNLSNKKIALSASFTVFFDSRGIPYSAYTDENTNTPLNNVLTVNVTPQGKSSPTRSISITPLTGYIQ